MHNSHKGADKRPTLTFKVEEALKNSDDFLQVGQILKITGLTRHQADVSLQYLRHAHAVDCLAVEGSGLWWFTTAESDTRPRKVEERVREEPGSRGGRIRKVKPKPGLGDPIYAHSLEKGEAS